MFNIKSGGRVACVGAGAAFLLASVTAGNAAPLSVMPRAAVTSFAPAMAPTDIRYIHHRGAGRAIAGAALGLFGLALGSAIANNNGPYYYPYDYGYYPYANGPYYAYAPRYRHVPHYRYVPHRVFHGHAHIAHPHFGHAFHGHPHVGHALHGHPHVGGHRGHP